MLEKINICALRAHQTDIVEFNVYSKVRELSKYEGIRRKVQWTCFHSSLGNWDVQVLGHYWNYEINWSVVINVFQIDSVMY